MNYDPVIADENLKRFANLNIAVMDADPKSTQTTRTLLSSLGVFQFRIFRHSQEMLDSLKKETADVIIADLGLKTDAELEAIQRLRQETSPLAFTPVIVLSSNNTVGDVKRVIDAGANELVAKPANIRSIFTRLQTIIDHPRSFVATKDFKGPDRRRKTNAKKEGESRQTKPPIIVSSEEFMLGSHPDTPTIIMPDFGLKVKVTQQTPGIAKQQIENEFLFHALSDVAALETCEIKLSEGLPAAPLIERICASCLSIKARASAYQYTMGSKIAGLLINFCRNHFIPGKRGHLLVLEKHIQVLSTIFHQRLSGEGGKQGQELQEELSQLVKKYI